MGNEVDREADELGLTLLGVPSAEFRGDEVPLQSRHLALIAYVALQGRPCPREEVIGILWGEGRSQSLRTALYMLRRLPGADAWLRDDETLDVRARSDVERLRRARQVDEPPEALLPLLDRYANSDPGALLLGLAPPTDSYAEWLEEQRRRNSELLEQVLLRAARDRHARGDHTRARGYTERVLARDSLHESAYRLLMQIEHDSGQPEAARRAFERCRAALREQLGEEPGSETLALQRQLLGTGNRRARGTLLRPGDQVPGRAARLIGRDALLERLERSLRDRPTLLHGFGGVGKTALAAELAAGRLADGAVLWLRAGWSDTDELTEAAGLALDSQGGIAYPDALRQALGREGVILVVLDDVWQEAAAQGFRERLPDDLELMVTARQRLPGFARLDVGVLERLDAHRLLVAEAGREFDDDATDRLCSALGDHPFALRLAGAKLRSDRFGPQQLLTTLADAPHTLRTPRSWRGQGRESVGALLQTSLDALDEDAYDAFLAIGALDSGGVTAALLAHLLRRDLDAADEALIELHTRALAERVASAGSDAVRYALHDLAHTFAQQSTIVRPRSVIRACRAFVAERAHDLDALDSEIDNLVGALDAARATDDRRALLEMMAELAVGNAYFAARGHTPRSLELLAVAVRWATDAGDAARAHGLAGRLGDAFRAQYGRYPEALTAYRESVRLARLAGDPGREAVLTSMCGVTRHVLGEPSQEDFDRAQRLAEEAGDGLALGQVLQHRSYVAGSGEDWAEAERLSARSVAIARKLRDDPDVDQARVDYNLSSALLNLGEARWKLGDFDAGVEAREEALRIATERDNQLWRAWALHELGEMHFETQRFEVAERYLGEALELYEANHSQAEIRRIRDLLSERS